MTDIMSIILGEPGGPLLPYDDWRELERARLAADPYIQRVTWACLHLKHYHVDPRYANASGTPPKGNARWGTIKGFSGRGFS